MNKRQEKKQHVICLPYPNKKVPRKRIIRRLKKTAFAGYIYFGAVSVNYRLSTKHPWRHKCIKKAFKYKTHNNLDILFKYAEDMCNYDLDWLDYVSFHD